MATPSLLQNWNPSSAAPLKEAAAGVRGAIVDILALLPSLRVAHWQASTKTNEHQALGELYTTLDGLLDDFTETLMGLEGSRELPSRRCSVETGSGFEGLVGRVKDLVNQLVSETSAEADLNNIAADMRQAVSKACYLLEIGKN